MRVPPFIEQWGLDSDADERAVKRAYATRLKKIDQEADPAGFQQLRETYETALRWVKAKEAAAVQPAMDEDAAPLPEASVVEASPVDAPPADAPPADSTPSPEQLASAVFDDFMSGLPMHVRTMNDAVAALHRHLDDVRLVNLEARTMFEWLIGRRLAEGWRPGHEVLLVAATDCFQWEADRSRLGHFGRVGAMLDAALNERAVFHSQPEEVQAPYRTVIHQLRQDGHPGKAFLLKHMGPLETLGARLPNWLWVITKVENIQAWRAWTNELPQAKKAGAGQSGSTYQAPPAKKSGMHWWAVIALVMFIGRIASHSSSSSPDYKAPTLSSALSSTASSRASSTGSPSQTGDQAPVDAAPVTISKDAYGLPIPVPSLDQSQAQVQTGGNNLEDVGLTRSGSHLYKGLPNNTAVYPSSKPSHQAEQGYKPPPDRVPTSPSRMDKVIHDFDPGKNIFSTPAEAPRAEPHAEPITPPSPDRGP